MKKQYVKLVGESRVAQKLEAIQWTGKNKNEIEEFIGVFGKIIDNQVILGIHTGEINDYIVKDIMCIYYPVSPTRFIKKYKEI